MPNVITHDLLGREIYGDLHEGIGESKAECDAFLLGCQGPDVLFFAVMNPFLVPWSKLGTQMHESNPDDLLEAFRDSACAMSPEVRPIGEAYVKGLFCHYILDSTMHPFIFSQQYAICDAGVEGLDRKDGHEVHAEIESELDLLVLTEKEGRTIASFDPATETLRADEDTLFAISCLYRRVAKVLFGKSIPTRMFLQSTVNYRLALMAFHSPMGVKREAIGRIEELFRNYSMLRALSHKNKLVYESEFDNRNHAEWVDPFTGVKHRESFWDLYEIALAKAREFIPKIMTATRADIEARTNGIDFKGRPASVRIVSVQDV